jgi:rubrerythrin
MSLETRCFSCGELNIPKRIKGTYIGNREIIKIWECRICGHLWQ